ncbi:hypothetical protein HMPREF1862_01458 [Varibaculum cambriense]|uniref:Uncharacterized protein n=1 Tax=Varibaculum cambriense TaxID=184870 RepID=A0AB34WYB6_9ACTO|nr:hypothetical protein HMPREF1862_01458 [Varibaculum cambriense]
MERVTLPSSMVLGSHSWVALMVFQQSLLVAGVLLFHARGMLIVLGSELGFASICF